MIITKRKTNYCSCNSYHIILSISSNNYCRRKFSERKQRDGSADKQGGFFNSMRTFKSPHFITQTVWIDDMSEGVADVREASQSQAIHDSSGL